MMAKKKAPTKAESKHMDRVAALGCIACQQIGFEDTPAEIHHIRATAGAGQRSSHFDVIPLCFLHHRIDGNAIHRSKVNFEADFGTELELLAMVKNSLNIAA